MPQSAKISGPPPVQDHNSYQPNPIKRPFGRELT